MDRYPKGTDFVTFLQCESERIKASSDETSKAYQLALIYEEIAETINEYYVPKQKLIMAINELLEDKPDE